MNEVEMNKEMKLSPHFTLGELTKTSYHTSDGNIPSHTAIENLKRICGWLEILRERYNQTTPDPIPEQSSPTRSLSYSGGEAGAGQTNNAPTSTPPAVCRICAAGS